MSIANILVLFAVIWTIVFFIVNPFGQVSQSESGEVVKGTPASAPVNPMLLRKAVVTTAIALVLLALAWAAVEREWLTLEDFGWAKPPASY